MKALGLMSMLLLMANASAEVTPASLFQDKMVLQRGMKVPVWGKADPSEEVKVSFAGQNQSTKAGKDGKWMVYLDALEASHKGREMEISGSNSIVLSDVVVGEVWLCSGQSNMKMEYQRVPEVRAMVRRLRNVRCFDVEKTVAFKAQDTLNGAWKEEAPTSAVAAGFAILLEKAVDVPVGIILSCWGSSSLEAWMPYDMTEQLPKFKEQMDVFDADKETKEKIEKILQAGGKRNNKDDIFLRVQPNILYNAMIAPLVPYACRGVVWYQGERNASTLEPVSKGAARDRVITISGYGNALKQWIKRYRKEWKSEEMHFTVVMLPGFAKKVKDKENPAEASWAWMREAQLEALELPNTSVVTTIDLGHPTNIHPNDKLPIAERVALLAQRDTLGMDILAEGPVMKKVNIEGSSLMIEYNFGNGLKTKDGEAPKGFWVSSNGESWQRADAEIRGEQVLLSSTKVSEPRFVRYAFAAMPQTNLVNSAGLPARPFRTDK